jgi:anti-sigma factor RsiW
MRCDRARPLLPLLVDGALDPLRRRWLSHHLAGCVACSTQWEDLQAMQAALRTTLPYHRAPPDLAVRIGAMLPREVIPQPSQPWRPHPALLFGGGGITGALAALALVLLVIGQRPHDDAVLRAVVDGAIRSRMADHLTDVQTSDQHTVKPWLSARLDISPAVPELKNAGFPLVGGRLDYLDGHPAAAIVYRHAQHIINLFAWAAPGQPASGLRTTARQGFNVITWCKGGITYDAVSDLEADQLEAFAKLVANES